MVAEEDNLEMESEDQASPAPRLDDISRLLLRIILLLVVVLLGTTLTLLFYLSTLNRAPRTALERDVVTWETAVKENPGDAGAWTRLAYAYAEGGRTDDALDAVERGRKATDSPALMLVEGDVLRSAGRYTEALSAYNRAEKDIRAAAHKVETERKKLRIFSPADESALGPLYFGRGLSKRELGDLEGAASDLEKAVKQLPDQATVLVALGDVYADLGHNDKAKASYEAALRFVPDDKDALDGLRELEGGKR